LPIGIQIIGPYMEDATPIDFATMTKELFGGFKPPSGYED
jgi:amidase